MLKTAICVWPAWMRRPCIAKTQLVMKLTIVLLTACLLHASAKVVSQDVSFSGENIRLETVFTSVEKQTGFIFIYKQVTLRSATPITVDAQNVPLEQFLDEIFKLQPLKYSIKGLNILVSPKFAGVHSGQKTSSGITGELLLADTLIDVRGRIVDEKGNPVLATLQVKGGPLTVSTNDNGEFRMAGIDQRSILLISGVSIVSTEIKVNGRKYLGINVKTKVDTEGEVVITGYGSIRKEAFTGTVTQVTKSDLQKVTPGKLIEALQVFDPSFKIQSNIRMGSNPNTLPEFYIRGQSGFPGVKELDKVQAGSAAEGFALKNNPNIPIFILDGFEVGLEKIYDLDINRINRVTILKDAAATAMYGSRASNGVVVIETIAPKPGEIRVTYNGNFAVTLPDLSSYNLMDAKEKLAAENAAKVYLPRDPEDPNYDMILRGNQWYMTQKENSVRKGVNTYWLSQPLRGQFNHKHNVYVEGGSSAMRFGLELKQDIEKGVMKGSMRKRSGVGLTTQYQLPKLQLRNQVYFDAVNSTESPYGSFSDYTSLQPYYPMFDQNTGEYLKTFPDWSGTTIRLNPLYEAGVGNFTKNNYQEWTDNFTANWYVFDNFFLRGQFAIDYKLANGHKFISPTSPRYDNVEIFRKGELKETTTRQLNWNTNIFGSFDQAFGKNKVNVSAGINALASTDEFSLAAYRGFPGPGYHSPAHAHEIITKPSLEDNRKRLFGSFSVLNYTYNDIYLFDGSFRTDGSSEFGTERKWAPFWSVGSGINLHNTSLLKNNGKISLLRLTANIGQTGKSNFSPYMARNTYSLLLDDWYPTGIGATLIYMGNNRLTWEKQLSWNGGLLFSWEKRYTLEMNYYHKRTYDLITDVSLPSSSGFTVYRDNIGEVLNKGIEAKLMAELVRKKQAGLVVFGNLAHNTNQIVKIAESLKRYNKRIDDYYGEYINNTNPVFALAFNEKNAPYARPFTKYEEGSSLTTIYGMNSLGIDPASGREVYLKRDGSITYDWSAAEQQPIGNSEPDITGAFGVNFRFKQFTLYSSFLYELGGDQYNQTLVNNVENANLLENNADRRVLTQRWQKPGDITSLKNIADRYYITRPTSRFLQRNNYVSFNSLSLGYDFLPSVIKAYRLSSLRLSFIMNDIALFSTIKREMGLDYPYARTFTFTINASF